MAAVATIETHRVASQQTSHDSGKRYKTGSKQEVNVVGHQRLGKTRRGDIFQDSPQPLDPVVAVFVVAKDLAALYPSDNDMMDNAGGIDPGFAGHKSSVAYRRKTIYLYINGRP